VRCAVGPASLAVPDFLAELLKAIPFAVGPAQSAGAADAACRNPQGNRE